MTRHRSWSAQLKKGANVKVSQMFETTPEAITPEITAFCETIVSGAKWEGRSIPSRWSARVDIPSVRRLVRVHEAMGTILARYAAGEPFQPEDVTRYLTLSQKSVALAAEIERQLTSTSPRQRAENRKRQRKAAAKRSRREPRENFRT